MTIIQIYAADAWNAHCAIITASQSCTHSERPGVGHRPHSEQESWLFVFLVDDGAGGSQVRRRVRERRVLTALTLCGVQLRAQFAVLDGAREMMVRQVVEVQCEHDAAEEDSHEEVDDEHDWISDGRAVHVDLRRRSQHIRKPTASDHKRQCNVCEPKFPVFLVETKCSVFCT